MLLANRARSGRKRIIGIPANQAHGADHNDQNNGKHNRIFGYILTLFFQPDFMEPALQRLPPRKGRYRDPEVPTPLSATLMLGPGRGLGNGTTVPYSADGL